MNQIIGLVRRTISNLGLFSRIAMANLIALVPLGFFAIVQMDAAYEALSSARKQAALGLTTQAALPVTSKLAAARTIASNIALQAPELLKYPETCQRVFQTLQQAYPEYNYIGYRPLPGQPDCAQPTSTDPQLTNKVPAARTDATQPTIFLSELLSEQNRSVVVGALHPVYTSQKTLAGHVIVTIAHEVIQGAASTAEGIASTPLAWLTFDSEGRIITTSEPLEAIASTLPASPNLRTLAMRGSGAFDALSQKGEERVYAVSPLGEDLFLLGAWAKTTDGPYLSETISGYLLAALMVISGLAAALFASEFLVIRHIRKLSTAMRNFAEGERRETSAQLDNPPREIAELDEGYHTMTLALLKDEAELEHHVHQREKMLRELHHRTGNSLQLIASILRMHLREDPSPQVRQILEDLHDRVMGLSTVHLGLYRLTDYVTIEMSNLLDEVLTKIDALRDMNESEQRVTADLSRLALPVEAAVPLALLTAEIVSAFLYGAQTEADRAVETTPKLHVTLKRLPNTGTAELEISGPAVARGRITGNGGGAPGAIAARLIKGFLRQIEGDMVLGETHDELRVRITFAPGQSSPPPDDHAPS